METVSIIGHTRIIRCTHMYEVRSNYLGTTVLRMWKARRISLLVQAQMSMTPEIMSPEFNVRTYIPCLIRGKDKIRSIFYNTSRKPGTSNLVYSAVNLQGRTQASIHNNPKPLSRPGNIVQEHQKPKRSTITQTPWHPTTENTQPNSPTPQS
jgi:hypothetical protein